MRRYALLLCFFFTIADSVRSQARCVSLNAPVTVFLTGMPSSNSNSNVSKLTDGISSAANFYEILPGNVGSRIVIELSDSFALSRAQTRTNILSAKDFRLHGYEMRASLDGVQWILVAADSKVETTLVDVVFPPQKARFFEITITRMDSSSNHFPTILGEISLYTNIDRPTVTDVSVAFPSGTSEYRSITWNCYQWDTSKTVSIYFGPSREEMELVAANVKNTGSCLWRTSVVSDGPRLVRVIPDTAFSYSGEGSVTIANFTSTAANVVIPYSYSYEATWPPLYSAALKDTIHFNWTYNARYNFHNSQKVELSVDSGATWVTILNTTDTTLRSLDFLVEQSPLGGEKCFLRVTVFMDNAPLVSIPSRLLFQLAVIPAYAQWRWSRTGLRFGDTFESFQLPERRGLIGYRSAAGLWRILAGPELILDDAGNYVGNWNTPYPFITSAVIGDANGDSISDVVMYRSQGVSTNVWTQFVVPDTGTPPSENFQFKDTSTDFQLIDVDGDDSLEIAYTYESGAALFHADGHFYRTTAWARSTGSGARYFDLLGNSLPELVATSGSKVMVFDSSGGAVQNFPSTFASVFSAPPLPFDVDGDGRPEILAAGQSQVYCLTATGTVVPGFPVTFQGTLISGPSVGDIDADGDLDFVVVLDRNGVIEVHCYDAHGSLLDGWPREFPEFSTLLRFELRPGDTVAVGTPFSVSPAQPLLASLDGDNLSEILISTSTGLLYIYHADGTSFTGSPVYIGTRTSEAGVLGDFNSDGRIEYAYPIFQEYPPRYSVACLDFGAGSYNANAIPWPMYLADAAKSGRANSAVVVGVDGAISNEIPTQFSLSQNYPNPFNPSTTIRYSLPNSVHTTIRIVNLVGQTVAMLVDGTQDAGTHVTQFDGSRFASGVYLFQIFAGPDFGMRKMLLLK